MTDIINRINSEVWATLASSTIHGVGVFAIRDIPKGTKLADGQMAKAGSIIVRQRGTVIMAGKNTRLGRDHTIFASAPGVVKFGTKRKLSFAGLVKTKSVVTVNPIE